MRFENIPPYAPILMESTRAIGYSTEAAVADIIDNSITAKATQIDIDYFPVGESYISILDNGYGMSESELIAAMQYGSKNPLDIREEYDLGRYGLGLKTASLSQCRVLTVITKKNGRTAGAQWNLNHIRQKETWSLIILDENEIKNITNWNKLNHYTSGTLVLWQDLDKLSIGEFDTANAFQKKMTTIREHLSLVFHRYLSGEPGLNKIKINMNEQLIIPQDPFLQKKSTQLIDEEVIIIRGEKIKIIPYILPHTSKLTKNELTALGGKDGLRKLQGFYVYRKKRLLVWGTWFRLMRHSELSKLARVQIDIPNSLDDLWTLDIKKSTAVPPEEIKRNLAVIIEKISEGSRRTWIHRGKKETNNKIVHIWNRMKTRDGSIYYEINSEHPLISLLKKESPQISSKLDLLLKQISMTLPLNSLYIDLTNDEKLTNENETNSSEIINIIKKIISSYPTEEQKETILNSLLGTEPFSAFINDINEAKNKGEFND